MTHHSTHLGCRYWYEAYLQKSTMDSAMWNRTVDAVTARVGILRKLKIIVTINENMVRYYFGANRNLSELSNALEHMSLRPIDPEQVVLPPPGRKEWLVNLVPGGNIIDLRERMSVARGKELEAAVFTIKRLSLDARVSCSIDFVFASRGSYALAHKQSFTLPGNLLAINFRENEKYGYNKTSRHLDIKKALHMLKSDSTDALLEVETYPYLQQNAYLNLPSYDFDKHSFIVGASGSGKSKLISLMIERLLRSPMAGQYRVVVVDPHATLEQDLQHIQGAQVLNFRNNGQGAELFAENNTDISAATELTATLFQSLMGSQYTAQLERIVRYSLTTLMTAQVMSLPNLRRFLTEDAYRANVLTHVENHIPAAIKTYFNDTYAITYRTQYSENILPILELIDEIDLRANTTHASAANSLAQVVQSSPLTVFSLNKVSMGEKVIKTVSGLLISQLFLLAQSRQFNEKIILVVDEVSVIQNPVIAQILAEARKYNLFIFLSQQYFGQVNKELQDAIFSNVSNYYVFKVSEADARVLEGNITMELPRKTMMEATRTIMNEEDKRVPLLTSLDPRQCIVRVSSGGKLLPAFRGRTVDFAIQQSTQQNSRELTEFTQHTLPDKYVDQSLHTTPQFTVENKPQVVAAPTENLMEVLAKQSSHRNKRGASS